MFDFKQKDDPFWHSVTLGQKGVCLGALWGAPLNALNFIRQGGHLAYWVPSAAWMEGPEH
jgi:hypothetical protein